MCMCVFQDAMIVFVEIVLGWSYSQDRCSWIKILVNFDGHSVPLSS